jgi:hypothetical protein
VPTPSPWATGSPTPVGPPPRRRRRPPGLLLVAATLLAGSLAQPAAAAEVTVAMWHMEETTGLTMTDSSGRGNAGRRDHVAVGAVGVAGRAYRFDGRSSIVRVLHSRSLTPGTAPLKISAWLLLAGRPTGTDDYDVVRKGTWSSPGGFFKMQIGTDGRANCRFRGSLRDALVVGGQALDDGRWHAVLCRKRDGHISVEVDGRVTARPVRVGSIGPTDSLTLGAKALGNDYYAGRMDEVRIGVG